MRSLADAPRRRDAAGKPSVGPSGLGPSGLGWSGLGWSGPGWSGLQAPFRVGTRPGGSWYA